TVTSAPTGITCGVTCSASFASGTAVTLTAAPAAGSTFSGWSGGGCTGTGSCVVTLSAAATVTATFTGAVTQFTLSLGIRGSAKGTVTSNPSGITCGASCSAVYASGTIVTLTVAPGIRGVFQGVER